MRSVIACAFVIAALGGCDNRSTPPAQPAALAEAPVEQASTDPPPTPAPAEDGICSGADLQLSPTTLAGRVGGKDIVVGDFGPDAAAAETKALRDYCNAVQEVRDAAFGRAVQQRLLEAAAQAEGQDLDSFVRERVESLVQTPTQDEMLAFYEANKTPQTPPFETVKGDVEAAITGQQRQKKFDNLVSSLRSKTEIESLLPDIRPRVDVGVAAHSPTFGPPDAKVTLVEFSDFECPYCARAATAVAEVKKRYADKVQFAYRHFPLSFHPIAQPAAEYAQCAAAQNKFWEFHDAVFADKLTTESLEAAVARAALDNETFRSCVRAGDTQEQVAADLRTGQDIGVQGTPTFYINGRLFTGSPTPEGLGAAIDTELARL